MTQPDEKATTEPTHCGHPADAIQSSGEGTSYCRMCAGEKATPEHGQVTEQYLGPIPLSKELARIHRDRVVATDCDPQLSQETLEGLEAHTESFEPDLQTLITQHSNQARLDEALKVFRWILLLSRGFKGQEELNRIIDKRIKELEAELEEAK